MAFLLAVYMGAKVREMQLLVVLEKEGTSFAKVRGSELAAGTVVEQSLEVGEVYPLCPLRQNLEECAQTTE